jgi:hypothetical protein
LKAAPAVLRGELGSVRELPKDAIDLNKMLSGRDFLSKTPGKMKKFFISEI